jgi:hypothetical protein
MVKKDSLGRRAKEYYAHFTNEKTRWTNGSSILIEVDGISLAHANARAWIKFMKTQSYRENEGGWELEELKLAK